MSQAAWKRLRQAVVNCDACPRLREYCLDIAKTKRRAYLDQSYWGKPVPNFGGPNAKLLVVGLAPGAHGANRTGRMFTGDRSGDWLFRSLHKFGFASQSAATHCRDGLKLIDAAITNIGRCAPPGNRPSTEELRQCAPYFEETIRLTDPVVMVALGQLAWNRTLSTLVDMELYHPPSRRPKFGHGHHVKLNQRQTLLGSYHPSQQNTFTGRLTEAMLDRVFRRARKLVDAGA